jgi:ubiquitin
LRQKLEKGNNKADGTTEQKTTNSRLQGITKRLELIKSTKDEIT